MNFNDDDKLQSLALEIGQDSFMKEESGCLCLVNSVSRSIKLGLTEVFKKLSKDKIIKSKLSSGTDGLMLFFKIKPELKKEKKDFDVTKLDVVVSKAVKSFFGAGTKTYKYSCVAPVYTTKYLCYIIYEI